MLDLGLHLTSQRQTLQVSRPARGASQLASERRSTGLWGSRSGSPAKSTCEPVFLSPPLVYVHQAVHQAWVYVHQNVHQAWVYVHQNVHQAWVYVHQNVHQAWVYVHQNVHQAWVYVHQNVHQAWVYVQQYVHQDANRKVLFFWAFRFQLVEEADTEAGNAGTEVLAKAK
ncbi:hypothetical protein NHX12_017578 [Muraenolepis orangiensis]|uniref:Uncharacterized protein n=1 Tax=Muraenolepis orangiensis TaxID=630683 RepID=A0A9Q0EV13_9TELE|nr:hypothetical protein NHX12_017578 [Muraenolepis orangiensis]